MNLHKMKVVTDAEVSNYVKPPNKPSAKVGIEMLGRNSNGKRKP